MTPEYGEGLDGLLRAKGGDFVGIVNGAGDDWRPERDPMIAFDYGVDNYNEGKAANKKLLQEKYGLEVSPNVPVFAASSRMSPQKGITFMPEAIERAVKAMLCQFIVIGQGEKWAEHLFGEELPARYPGRVAGDIG